MVKTHNDNDDVSFSYDDDSNSFDCDFDVYNDACINEGCSHDVVIMQIVIIAAMLMMVSTMIMTW